MKRQTSSRAAVGDLLYVQMETALRQKSCPLCWHMSLTTKKFYKFLLREGISADNIYQSLMRSWGLCSRHAWAAAEAESAKGGKLGNSAIYRLLLHRLAGFLQSYPLPAPRKKGLWGRRNSPDSHLQQWLNRLAPQEPCLACAHFQIYEESVVGGFSKIIADPLEENFKAWYRQSFPLCLRHFRLLLSATPNSETAEFILRCQQQKVQKLLASLDSYINLCRGEYNQAKEVKISGDDTWRKALEFFAGII